LKEIGATSILAPRPEAVLKELGFRRVINAAGHYTILGGSQPSPEVNEVMAKAAEYWINMNELQESVGHFLSSTLHCEDGMITSGAYAAIMVATNVAILRKKEVSPRPQVIIQSSHVTKYAEAFRAAGAELIEIGRKSDDDSIAKAIGDTSSTVALAYVLSEENYEFSLPETVEAGNQFGLPVIVDASLVDPPIQGIRQILEYDPHLIAVSGGKGFNGPNSTGILIGKEDLIRSARQLSFPNYGIGRGMKVSKEQIAGLAACIKKASEIDENLLIESWRNRIASIQEGLASLPGVSSHVVFPWKLNLPQPIYRLFIFVGKNDQDGSRKAAKLRQILKDDDPPVITRSPADTNAPDNVLVIEGRCLRPEDLDPLIESLNRGLRTVMGS
jgi:seryl-tRNA(Sec) selenium transferase